jgi:hypothetical protein
VRRSNFDTLTTIFTETNQLNAKIGKMRKVRKACADIKYRQRNMRRLLGRPVVGAQKPAKPPEYSQNNSSNRGYETFGNFGNLDNFQIQKKK